VERSRWDARHREADGPGTVTALLAEQAQHLPRAGRALDLACGLGADALMLAARGLETHAWDRSPVAIERLREQAAGRGLSVHAAVRDVLARPPGPEAFDLIVVAHFLERALAPAICRALRPGGVLFYQTFSRAEPLGTGGPRNPAYRLDPGELRRLFAPLQGLLHREPGSGAPPGLAQLIARREA
jgi:SAM-dependent methyltransferase